MAAQQSLFAHLALKFGSHPENLATEALGYVLRCSRAARAAMASTMSAVGANVAEDAEYSTQSVGDDSARPDLVARSASGTEPLLIEVKFWAGLTDNQPVSYLRRLPANGTLLVVAPAARATLLWGELERRCRDAPFDFHAQTLGDVHVASVGDRRLVLLSWRYLLLALRRQVEAANEPQTVGDIAQLEGLCERMDQDAFLPLSSEELTSGIHRRIFELGKIVDDATGLLVQRGIATTKGLRATGGRSSPSRSA
jgi:hypothetical protein